MSINPGSVADVVNGLGHLAASRNEVSLGDVLDEFGKRSFAPVMLVLALIEATPVGGIPGVPTALAIGIALVAAQLLIARDHIWVPKYVERRSISSRKLAKASSKLDRLAKKLDAVAHGRLKFLTRGPALQFAAVLILILCLTVPPLELVPFASTAPMLAIALISLALMVRDGLAMLLAMLLSLSALGYGTYLYWTGDMAEIADTASETIATAATATMASAAVYF